MSRIWAWVRGSNTMNSSTLFWGWVGGVVVCWLVADRSGEGRTRALIFRCHPQCAPQTPAPVDELGPEVAAHRVHDARLQRLAAVAGEVRKHVGAAQV
jgi:hypothetical protein